MNDALGKRSYRRSLAEIDLRRVKENFEKFCRLMPAQSFVCPMVKADAYGHGAAATAEVLRAAGAKHLGVALVEEGEELRQAGDTESLLVFGPVDDESAESVIRERLTVVASDWTQLEAIEQARNRLGEGRIAVHVEFNTGMNRLGFEVSEAEKVRAWFKTNSQIRLEGVCTHLLRGDDAGSENGESYLQLAAFEKVAKAFADMPNLILHALNSSGTINLRGGRKCDTEFEAKLGARPGIGPYGYGGKNDSGVDLQLKPSMTLTTHLVSVHRVEKGARVSYGPTWRSERAATIGVVPFGYADGYRRALSDTAQVLYGGVRAPVVGTVCMDYFMIDLTDAEAKRAKPVHVGEEIVLIGTRGNESVTAQDLADWAGTIPYEILTGISKRVPRAYIG